MPPAPRSDSIRYGPSLLPEVNAMRAIIVRRTAIPQRVLTDTDEPLQHSIVAGRSIADPAQTWAAMTYSCVFATAN